MAVEEGIERQAVIPATGEVDHVDLRTHAMDEDEEELTSFVRRVCQVAQNKEGAVTPDTQLF